MVEQLLNLASAIQNQRERHVLKQAELDRELAKQAKLLVGYAMRSEWRTHLIQDGRYALVGQQAVIARIEDKVNNPRLSLPTKEKILAATLAASLTTSIAYKAVDRISSSVDAVTATSVPATFLKPDAQPAIVQESESVVLGQTSTDTEIEEQATWNSIREMSL